MNQEDRAQFIDQAQREWAYPAAGPLSEQSGYLANDALIAFEAGAYQSTLLCCLAAIEASLRREHIEPGEVKSQTLAELIGNIEFVEAALQADLNKLRQVRNRWVHIANPHTDEDVWERVDDYDSQSEEHACLAIRTMYHVFFLEMRY